METITRNIPVLALRGLTAFPGQTVSFDAERDISIFALDNAMENDRRLLAMTQKDLSTAEPGEENLYTIGTVCHILQIIKTSDTTVRVIAEGESRARLHRLWQKNRFAGPGRAAARDGGPPYGPQRGTDTPNICALR